MCTGWVPRSQFYFRIYTEQAFLYCNIRHQSGEIEIRRSGGRGKCNISANINLIEEAEGLSKSRAKRLEVVPWSRSVDMKITVVYQLTIFVCLSEIYSTVSCFFLFPYSE